MSGWYGVDLDGTLAEHYWPEKGRYEQDRIGDPIPAMVNRVRAWLAAGTEVRVFTARVSPQGGIPVCTDNLPCGPFTTDEGRCTRCNRKGLAERAHDAIAAWTLEHVGRTLAATATKDFGMIALWDDRAVRVVTNTGKPCCADVDDAASAPGVLRVKISDGGREAIVPRWALDAYVAEALRIERTSVDEPALLRAASESAYLKANYPEAARDLDAYACEIEDQRAGAQRHAFIADCENSETCVFCGKTSASADHDEPHELTRAETEAELDACTDGEHAHGAAE